MRKNEEKGRNTGTDTTERNVMELFLEDVEAQIQYKPAARRISKELYGHLEDKTEEYKSEGLVEEEAMSCAVRDMGDAATLGVMMNDTHRVKLPWVFILSVVMAVLLGIAGNIAEYGSGDFSFEEKLFWIAGNAFISLWGFWCLRRYFGKAIHGLCDTATEFWQRQFCSCP